MNRIPPSTSSEAAAAPASLPIPNKRIDVAFLPQLLSPATLADRTLVVTDVLRATTTIIHALHNGCPQVMPQPNIDAARACHSQIPNSVMGGERRGKIIPGFQHGNSPVEYTPEVIAGKTLVLATTNGTVALEHCRGAKRVLIGAMINLAALAEVIEPDEQVTIVCSGTDGHITSEDVIFAGALVERLLVRHHRWNAQERGAHHGLELQPLLNDHSLIALNHWWSTCRAMEQGTALVDFFRQARGGINLFRIGLDADIQFAAQIDAVPVVPILDQTSWSIRLPN